MVIFDYSLLFRWIWGYWYPVWDMELFDSGEEKDVIERYQGVIRNDRYGWQIRIEWLEKAEKWCDRLNLDPIGTQRAARF